MTSAPFGRSSAGLLARLRPVPVDLAELREVAEDVLPELATAALRIVLVEDPLLGPVVVLREGERSLRTPLRDLAEDMTDAGVRPTSGALAAALCTWVAHRPVPDAAAAAAGIAVLDWTDASETAVGWRVVVRRGELALPWTPSAAVAPSDVDRVRAGATVRAAEVELSLHVEGPVALWSHAAVPLLASAALAAPDRVLARVAVAGLETADLQVVVTPGRPLACARAGVAARLAGETGEACVRLPWQQVAALPWV
ncbi:hypothetical protein [Blastococcus sp. SYSU D00820]